MTQRTYPLLVLVDGHALAYRAFFALPANMATSKGELTNAVYGFTSMLLQVLNDVQPDYIAVAFDVGRTFRHDAFADYKGHRAKQPDELSAQMERIRQVVEALNIPIFAVEGFEADDVIGTLARQAEQQGVETLIVTGDTDAFQLINAHTKVMTSGRRFSDVILYDEERVRERYGLAPHQLVDYKALVGDPSDNIPGVRGIGEKTAKALLQKYGSLDAIYAHLDEITPPRARRALEAGREIAFLSRDLVRIRTDVPIVLDLEACRARDFDREQVLSLFRELEFRTLVSRVPRVERQADGHHRPTTSGEAQRPVDYHIVATDEDLEALAARLAHAQFITFDVETDSTDALRAHLVGLALSVQEGEGFYIPIAHTGADKQVPNVPLERVRALIAPHLADTRTPTRAHNAKFDLLVLRQHGIHVTNVDFDTMIAAWLINPGHRNYGLKGLAFEKLGVEMTPITDLIGSRPSQQISMGEVPVEQAAAYACADVDMTTRLVRVLGEELHARAQWRLFKEVEMPLVPILAEMEVAGVAVDVAVLQELKGEL
ncbi:MAG: 5'-3' exonuclease H3TH domain-containing protein, partial [Ardenticatenia bacterium]|nr:5'-3' exonuclease H3TH domain-containing protein [Ardenticatenia bacterium]